MVWSKWRKVFAPIISILFEFTFKLRLHFFVPYVTIIILTSANYVVLVFRYISKYHQVFIFVAFVLHQLLIIYQVNYTDSWIICCDKSFSVWEKFNSTNFSPLREFSHFVSAVNHRDVVYLHSWCIKRIHNQLSIT